MKKVFASFGWVLLLIPFLSFAGTSTLLSAVTHVKYMPGDRQVSGFNGIHSSGGFDVHVKMGQTESLRIEGDEEQISKIETTVESGTLKIYYKRGINLRGWNKKVDIYITAKKLQSLSVSGSGDMDISGTIKGERLDTRVSGSGSISFTAVVNSLKSAVSGSGNIEASGSADAADISISGSGKFGGKDFKTKDSEIRVSGSGSAYIHAEDSLNAVVSGSGDIHYSGNPRVKQVKSGSGRINHI